jgi:serine/threonine-protein kinase RsbW
MEDSTMTGSRDDSYAGEGGTEVSVVIPAGLDHLPIPRRIAATLAATLDFDIDAVADLRMAVDEMVSTVVQRARPGAAVTTVFRADPGGVMVECSAATDGGGELDESSFGWIVLSTLADDLRARMNGIEDDAPHLKLSMTMRSARGAK